MLTYSINSGTTTESKNLASINDILSQIPDNTTHLIKPSDIRDAIFTAWNSAGVFKPTTISGSEIEYIGIDSTLGGDSLKEKILLGKRQVSGSDIMTNNLLTSDSDILFYNTKSDSDDQSYTKISILAGTDSTIYENAPYIESDVVGSAIDLSLVDPKGSINIIAGGTVSGESKHITLNGVFYPTRYQNALASNGQVLKYYNGQMVWSNVSSTNIDSFSSSGTFSIYGSPILLNGSPTTYTNATPTSATVGGISVGTTFNNVALVDMFTALLYPYIAPSVSITLTAVSSPSVVNNITSYVIAEYNSITSLTYNYTITKKSKNLAQILSPISESWKGGTPPLLSGPTRLSGSSTMVGTASYSGLSSYSYLLSVTDGTATSSTTAQLKYVYPYFYGVSSTPLTSFNPINTLGLTKVIQEVGTTSAFLSGTNVKVYFMYPSSYADLSSIKDTSTGYEYISSFTKTTITVGSSGPLWTQTYKLYTYTAGGGFTTVNSTFTFKH
jgi:hypothetical protein